MKAISTKIRIALIILLVSHTAIINAAVKKNDSSISSGSVNGIVTDVTDANGYKYEYGVIPVAANLCSSTSFGLGISVGANVNAAIHGEAGAGITFIGLVDAQAEVGVDVDGSIGMSSNSNISTSNCLPLIDTKSPVSMDGLSPEEVYFHEALIANTIGEELDTNEMALSVMRQTANLQTGLALSRSMLANYGVVTKTITEMITEGDPLNFNRMQGSLIRVVENTSDIIPPRLYNAMINLDQTFARHATNIDILGKSCEDLNSGNIEHLPDELINRLSLACSDWSEVQALVGDFIDTLNNTFEKTEDAANNMANLVANGDVVNSYVGLFENRISEINKTTETMKDGVSKLKESISQSTAVLEAAVEGSEEIVTASVDVMNETVNDVNTAASAAVGTTTSGLEKLKGEVDETVVLIENLTFGNITDMPGKIGDKITSTKNSICNLSAGFSVGFADINVSVREIAGFLCD